MFADGSVRVVRLSISLIGGEEKFAGVGALTAMRKTAKFHGFAALRRLHGERETHRRDLELDGLHSTTTMSRHRPPDRPQDLVNPFR